MINRITLSSKFGYFSTTSQNRFFIIRKSVFLQQNDTFFGTKRFKYFETSPTVSDQCILY